ncbi:dihydrofolate reductase family protein [Levilactobacillus fujinensis]|uniref:Dihydrofolate reductase family protein n=1 Tax=Levilactobacillus fujinensis TaxID=2486024 RepID=A0ABW1THP9_9LACO|nr:dihydrofolate reductase family protein [Levilactobacillus fujinensis]
MGKIQFYGATSLDGYLATSDDNIDWLTTLPNIPADTGQTVLSQMTSAIMGRVTYDYVTKLAPDMPFNPANPDMHNYVLTHQSRPSTPTVTFTSVGVLALAQRLQSGPGNIWVVGGQTILTPLLAANLIDDLYLQIAPIMLGSGKRLFGELAAPRQFELAVAHTIGPLAELIYHKIQPKA